MVPDTVVCIVKKLMQQMVINVLGFIVNESGEMILSWLRWENEINWRLHRSIHSWICKYLSIRINAFYCASIL